MCMGSFGLLRVAARLVPTSVCIGRQKGMDPDRFTSLRLMYLHVIGQVSETRHLFYLLIATAIFYYNICLS